MTLQQILYALTIAECGSMNKASEKLFIVQPTLTSAIQELENEVGLTIFLRTRKGVIPTPEGAEFLDDIRNFYRHYNMVMQKYEGEGDYKRKFGVSTQHYSFAVKAFTEMAKKYDMKEFDFAIRETQTKMVLTDVGSLKSEIGVLFMSSRNRKAIEKIMKDEELEFHPLIKCRAYVYLWGQPRRFQHSNDSRCPACGLGFRRGNARRDLRRHCGQPKKQTPSPRLAKRPKGLYGHRNNPS